MPEAVCYGSPLGPCALPNRATSHFQIVPLPNCVYTLHAGFRGRGRLGAHKTSARNEGAGSGHGHETSRVSGYNVASTKDGLQKHIRKYFLKGYSYRTTGLFGVAIYELHSRS